MLRSTQRRGESTPDPARPTFPALFEEQGRFVWMALRRLGANTNDLEDLTHDVFVQVFRQLDSYDPTRPIKPWLFGFAFRIFSKQRRRGRQRQEGTCDVEHAVDQRPSAIDQLLMAERRSLAWAALESLELKRRAVFIMHELEGCSIPEVASALDMPLATAYSRLRLAREDFAQAARRLRSRQR